MLLRITATVSVRFPSQSPTTGRSLANPYSKARSAFPVVSEFRRYQVLPRRTPGVSRPSPSQSPDDARGLHAVAIPVTADRDVTVDAEPNRDIRVARGEVVLDVEDVASAHGGRLHAVAVPVAHQRLVAVDAVRERDVGVAAGE